MSAINELPEWVWNLLDALEAYEDEHPLQLYTYSDYDAGKLTYVRTPCFGHFLGERKAWPPREVMDAAEFRRSILAQARDNTQVQP